MKKHIFIYRSVLITLIIASSFSAYSQNFKGGKKISTDLFGLFFEDINYSADGGLYAEMVQNRSFEYNPTEQREWNPYSFWEYLCPGFSFGRISIETKEPLHQNNPHYMLIEIEHVGHEAKYTGETGVGLRNSGFDGMVIRSGESYNFSMSANLMSEKPVLFSIGLQDSKGKILASGSIAVTTSGWNKYTATLTATESCDTASLVLLAQKTGKIALDMISLFPQKTFKNRVNGLRSDMAQLLADMEPRFIRFPGGCLVHGDGLGNMYRWKNTIGPLEQRKEQRNIWGYHQTTGLGYFEYFQFCEDIGAKPLPVLPAAVSCQNSGGTWRIGGTGQKALQQEDMKDYVQEVLDLIEWANGPADSKWGSVRAQAGHPQPFNLEYIGIGNEDKITPEFEQRFKQIYVAIKSSHPEITVIGTAGPFHSGEDFEKGWKLAKELNVPVIDEHYYTDPTWFLDNHNRYDSYDRKGSQVYLGEYASWGNKMINAIAEAAFLTSLERNGDIVRMASYAPLLAKKNFTQWKTDMIFFDNVNLCPTPNYFVQKMFMNNPGDRYFEKIITKDPKDSTLAASCVVDSSTGDIILKMVNAGNEAKSMKIDLSRFGKFSSIGEMTILTGSGDAENTFENMHNIKPEVSVFNIDKKFIYAAPAMSLTVIRVKTKNN